jgi:prolyl oligopeptidase
MMAFPILAYPQTPTKPQTETIGGITFDDPYAWLEEDSSETLKWQRGQNEVAEAYLRGWPGYEKLRAAVTPHIARSFLCAPQRCGEGWFELCFAASGPVLTVSDTPGGDGRILVDPARLSEAGKPLSLDWFYPSPDGRYVAYGLSVAGDEQSVLHVIETATGTVLPERIPFTSIATVAWLPDASGFYYNAGTAPDWEQADKHLAFHRLGDPVPSQQEPLTVRETYCVFPQVSPDGRWLAAITSEMDPRADYLKELPDGRWRPFLREVSGYCFGVFVGDNYIAICTEDAPHGRLVAIPILTATNRATWKDLVPESEAVLRSVTRVGDRLVLSQFVDAFAELKILTLDGQLEQEVPLPGKGTVLQLALLGHYQFATPSMGANISPGRDEFTFIFSTLTRSPALYRYDLRTRQLNEIGPPPVEHSSIVTRRETAMAADGTPICYSLVYRGELDLSRPQPTLIYGYGGWNASFIPSYLGCFLPFVEAGGIFVFAHLRGGGEYGTGLWQEGRLGRKQNTFDDLYTIAESLIQKGITTAERLAVVGASNGGLLTGVAVTQRPELWRAVCSLVPLCEMMKSKRDSYAATFVFEYGDPDDPGDAPVLYAYSPYHNVRAGECYPATLIYCGANDMRCRPWQSRKLAARLQAANTSEHPLLLRVAADAGHLSIWFNPEQVAEWLGFIMRELDLSP